MATYFLNLKTFGRSGGSSAVNAAAYRAGERILDERTGRTYDHADRQDVLHKEILVPSHLAGANMDWAMDRSNLWNSAERAESRKDARVAREYLVALPVELSPDRRIALARGFSRELTDRYQFAVDLSVHAPRDYPGSDPRNFHAHLLATTREVGIEGLTRKTTLEMHDARRRELGLPPAISELFHVRERWASVANESLREAGIDARIDHRSLAAQGIDREPYPHLPHSAFQMERHGFLSVQGERLRQEYRERVEARRERNFARERDSATHRESGPHRESETRLEAEARRQAEHAPPASKVTTEAPARGLAEDTRGLSDDRQKKPQSLEEVRRQARENWLKMREEMREQSRAGAERSRDDDLSF
jgi:ATP-dependent exoDNAse (exonuclease V) alpha subunit